MAEVSKQSPIPFEDITKAFIKLAAAGINPTREQLLLFSDVASVTADKMLTLNSLVDIYSRGQQGRLRLYDLDRLATAGLPAFEILIQKLGVARTSAQDFGYTVAGTQKILNALTEGLTERFAGASVKSLQNLSLC